MPSKRQERLAEIRRIAKEQRWREVDPAALAQLRLCLPEASEDTLRRDLRECGLALHPLVEGVRLDCLTQLGRSLEALAHLYREQSGSDARACRQAVLAARRKAEFVLQNDKVRPEIKQAMEEKLLWLRVWLENPTLFATWRKLRELQPSPDPAAGAEAVREAPKS
ncbi:MAG: hypothetical protein MUF01_17930 [Bryobacterales bacterium]|jgi:hypothetical protein|nr:hypothetical protein [Bryobacterales bacterium]